MPSTTVFATSVFSIELTDEDLTHLSDIRNVVEIDDVNGSHVVAPHMAFPPGIDDYDLVEIELTPEEMDKLLAGR